MGDRRHPTPAQHSPLVRSFLVVLYALRKTHLRPVRNAQTSWFSFGLKKQAMGQRRLYALIKYMVLHYIRKRGHP